MRTVWLALPVLFAQTAWALPDMPTDHDTVCATVYTYLSEAARRGGIGSQGFDAGSTRAQYNHILRNPGEDFQRYVLQVIDGAQTIREQVVRGIISTDAVVDTASGCNNRYFAQNNPDVTQSPIPNPLPQPPPSPAQTIIPNDGAVPPMP